MSQDGVGLSSVRERGGWRLNWGIGLTDITKIVTASILLPHLRRRTMSLRETESSIWPEVGHVPLIQSPGFPKIIDRQQAVNEPMTIFVKANEPSIRRLPTFWN